MSVKAASSEVMTAEDLAKYLKVHPNKVYKMVGSYEVPFTRNPTRRGKGGLRFMKEVIDQWMKGRMVYKPIDEAVLYGGRRRAA